MMKKGKDRKRIIIITVLIVTFFGMSLDFCNRNINHEMSNELEVVLHDVAELNLVAIEKEIEGKYNLLLNISGELTYHLDEIESVLKRLDSYIDTYHFKRIGYIDQKGIAKTTDGHLQDLSFRDFYKQSMKGQTVVTGVLSDALDNTNDDINVFSVPVYDTHQKVVGVLFATYRTHELDKVLNMESYEGKGDTYLLENDGSIIASSFEHSSYTDHNFFDMAEDNERNHDSIELMKQEMSQNRSGQMKLDLNESIDLYYTPLKLLNGSIQWYLVSVVPTEVLNQRLEPIRINVRILTYIVIGVGIAWAIGLIIYEQRRKKILYEIAYVDPLTQGHNFASFRHELMEHHIEDGYIVSVDLDNFKIINSTFGVVKGDLVIKTMWKVISQFIDKDEYAGHLSADAFVLWLKESDQDTVVQRIEQLQKRIEELSQELYVIHIIPKFGVYHIHNEVDGSREYEYANLAKKSIRGRRDCVYAFYDSKMHQGILEELDFEDNFDEAISKEQFEIWYQPKYNPQDNSLIGAEALVRWKTDQNKLIMPGKFIPLLEKTGTIVKLDKYVFEHVCQYQKQLLSQGKNIVPISINISRASLNLPNLVEMYKKIADRYQLDFNCIELEITESAMVNNTDIMMVLNQFKDEGFKILIDDFGTGTSSLSVVNMKSIYGLKIDKSLIDETDNDKGRILVKHIMNLAYDMGLHINAEGVETLEQVQFLKTLHCKEIQGYYYSKPLPQKDYSQLLCNKNGNNND